MLNLDDDEAAIALVALDEAIGCLVAADDATTASNNYVIRKMRDLSKRIEQYQKDVENGDV